MTGIERLRRLAEIHWGNGSKFMANYLNNIADQIEREHNVSDREEHDAAAWVREHGGLDYVRAEWRSRSNLKRMYEKEKAKVERQQRHIGFVQGKCRERQGHIVDLNKMVEEMRPRLMPEGMEWPRYESGELVQIGDDVINRFGDGPIKVRSVEFRDDNTTLHEGFKTDRMVIVYPGERVKRPAPKVLDADGVEVELGDDLYSVEGNLKFHVSHVDRANCKIATDAMFAIDKWADPSLFTHRAPVLAADGEPLEVGQTVWHTESGEQCTVLDIEFGSAVSVEFELTDAGCRHTGTVSPSHLTHQRPVLDADGNRIEPDMDVWWVCEGDERGIHAERLHVDGIDGDGMVECSPYNGGTSVVLEPSELYAKRPVLDADGVPIHEGDTVYLTDSPTAFVVDDIMTAENGSDVVHLKGGAWNRPQDLTHDRPDSWERIEEDATLGVNSYRERYGIKKHAGMTWPQLVREDLVRRCRALAERERGEA